LPIKQNADYLLLIYFTVDFMAKITQVLLSKTCTVVVKDKSRAMQFENATYL